MRTKWTKMNLSGPKWIKIYYDVPQKDWMFNTKVCQSEEFFDIYYDVAQKDWIFNTKVYQSEEFFDIQCLFDGMTLNTFLHSPLCVCLFLKKKNG